MNAIWMLCRSSLRNKKLQNTLIALLILLSTLLLATSVMVLRNVSSGFEQRHVETGGAHQMLLLDQGIYNVSELHEWWDKQAGVAVSDLLSYHVLSGVSYQGEELKNIYMYMMDTPKEPAKVDRLLFSAGEKSVMPAKNEVWIPFWMANNYGMQIGDHLLFNIGEQQVTFSISAVVVDLPFGAPFSNTARVWMNPDNYESYFSSQTGTQKYMMGVRYDHYEDNGQYWSKFTEDFKAPFFETMMDFPNISSFYLIMNQIISFIMIFLGTVMVLVSIFTIGFTISDTILANYTTIGVLRSTGMKSSGVVAAYVLQYTFLSIISIIPGVILSTVVSKAWLEQSFSNLQSIDSPIHIAGFGIPAWMGAVTFILVISCTAIYAGRCRHIQPVQAIRFGMSETAYSKLSKGMQSGGSVFTLSKLPLSLVIGFRNIIKNRKTSMLILILSMITSSVLVFGYLLVYSVQHVGQTSSAWGYDSSDISVEVYNKPLFPKEEFVKTLESDKRIKHYAFNYMTNAVSIVPAGADEADGSQQGESSLSLNTTIFDGNYDEMGYSVLKGRNPRYDNEVAIGANVAAKLKLELGDTIQIYVLGKEHQLIITGIYQAIANMSLSLRMIVGTVDTTTLDVVSFINVKEATHLDDVVSDINTRYDNILTAVPMQTLLESVYREAVNLLLLPMSLLGLLFITVTALVVYSVCRINIRKDSKTYGIYKSLGMTTNKIRSSIAIGMISYTMIGSIIGAFVGVYGMPLLLKSTLASYGILELPLLISWGGINTIVLIMIVAMFMGSWFSSRMIQSTSPRLLVVE